MIQFLKVKKQFDRLLFECGSITLPTRGIVDFIAPSGAGKTTLFNMIKGIDNDYEGDILIHGISAKKEMPKRIGYMSQNLNFVNNRTVKWHFDVVCQKDKRKEKLKDRFIYRLRLDEILDIYPSELSNGERKRVGFALVCLLDTPILLLDEPFADLMDDDILQIREIIEEESAKRLIIISNHIVSYRFNENILSIQNQQLKYQGNEEFNNSLEKKAIKENLWARNSFSISRFLCKFLSMIFLFLGILCAGYSNENVCLHEIKNNDIPIIRIRQNASEQYYLQAKEMEMPLLANLNSQAISLDEIGLKENEYTTTPVLTINGLLLSSVEDCAFTYQEQDLSFPKNEVKITDAWAKTHYKEYGLSSYHDFLGFNLPILKTQIFLFDPIENTMEFSRDVTIYRKINDIMILENDELALLYEEYEKSNSDDDFIRYQNYAEERNLSFIAFNEQISFEHTELFIFYENYTQLEKYLKKVSKNQIYAYQDILISEKLTILNHSFYLDVFMMMSEDFKYPLIILFFSLSILFYLLFMKKQEKSEKKYFKFYNSLGLGKNEIYRRSELRIIIDTCLAALLVPFVGVPIMVELNKLILYVGPFSLLWSLLFIIAIDFMIQALFIRMMKKY